MCLTTARARVLLPLMKTAAGSARDFARRIDCIHHPRELLDDALLLISEVVTNAVVHGRPQLVLSIECGADDLRVRVRDGAPNLPQQRRIQSDDKSGRGLSLLHQLSHAWGVELVNDEYGTGKEVWFELRARRWS